MQANSYAGGRVEHLSVGQENAKAVQAYLDYHNIVGDDDGGQMMSDEQFEAYKKKVAYARANHLYVFYTNAKGLECKAVGPSSWCFCKHRYKNHNFDNVKTKKVNCKNCKCNMFNHIPIHGSWDIKCGCHHSYEDHDPNTKKCLKGCKCPKFTSNYTCDCGMPYDKHITVIETREERMQKGKNVDSGNQMAAGMGGLGSFGGMVAGMYEQEYKDWLEGNDPVKSLPMEKKNMLGDGKAGAGFSGKGNSGGNQSSGVSALDLMNTPNKFASGGSVGGWTNKMGRMNIKK